MTRWEYCTVKFEPHGWLGGKTDTPQLQECLNELGSTGWEVTGVIETNTKQAETREAIILLKRPLPED